MADEIAYEIVDGSGGRKTRTGWELDRIATVYNITTSVAASAVILYAVDILEADGITIGSEHPSRSSLYLSDFELAGLSTEAVKVRLVYKEFPFGDEVIRVGAVTSQVVSNLGFLKNQTTKEFATALTDMSVVFTFPTNYEGVNSVAYAGKTMTTGVEATLFIPERTIVVTKQEVITGAEVSELARTYVGMVNADDWDLAPGDAKGTWLCTGIEGISNDNGLSYTITYSFQYRGDQWTQTVIYIDPNTGRPPDGVELGEVVAGEQTIGSKNVYAMQGNALFNALGLT